MSLKSTIKEATKVLEICIALFFVAITLYASWRLLVHVPSGGPLEEFIRTGLIVLGYSACFLWIIRFFDWITGQRK